MKMPRPHLDEGTTMRDDQVEEDSTPEGYHMGAEVRRYHDFNQIVCHSEPHGIDAFDDGYSSVPDQYTNGLGPLSNSPSMVSSQRNHPEATSLHHSYPVSNNAFPIPPPSHNRQLIGFSANTHDPTVPVGLYGHGSFSPASSRFGTPNMTLTGFNNFPSVYHNNVNDVLVNNRHPIIYPDGLPGSFDHTVPVTADLPLPIRLTNTPRGSSTVHTPPAGVSQADLNYPAHLISDHPSQMLQENWAGHAMAPSQQDRAFNSTYQTGRIVLSRPSSALIPHQGAGVVQSSHQIRVLPTSRLSHEQAHRTSNNCIPSIALHQLGNAQGQATCLVNSYHHSPYQSNTFQAQAANGSSQAGNSTRASQHQHSHTANSTPQITGYDQAIEIHFSPGLNSSGPSGQDDGRPSGEFQLPRIPRSLALLPTLGLRPSQNGLAGVKFHEFPRIPTEIRLMIWAYSIELGGPRFTFWGYMNLPPAMAQVSMEARGVYKKGLTYWMLASGQRFTIHEPKQNMRYFGHEVPGLKLCSPGTFSPIPTQMVPSLLPIGLLSVGQFADMPISIPENVSSNWMLGVTQIALPVFLAFTYFRRGAKRKADDNWKKLDEKCPNLQEVILISRARPTPTTTLAEMVVIQQDELDNSKQSNPEQHWASQIMAGHRRNLRTGNTRNFVFTYVVFF